MQLDGLADFRETHTGLHVIRKGPDARKGVHEEKGKSLELIS